MPDDELIARLVTMWRSVRMAGSGGEPAAREFISVYRGLANSLDELVDALDAQERSR